MARFSPLLLLRLRANEWCGNEIGQIPEGKKVNVIEGHNVCLCAIERKREREAERERESERHSTVSATCVAANKRGMKKIVFFQHCILGAKKKIFIAVKFVRAKVFFFSPVATHKK